MINLHKTWASIHCRLWRRKKCPPFVALMNEDEDVIVVTTLKSLPFCCHADLLVMSVDDLHAVARILNARVPVALRIDTGPERAAVDIRHDIERIAGYTKSAPDAMKVPFSIDSVGRRSTLQTPSSLPAAKRVYPRTKLNISTVSGQSRIEDPLDRSEASFAMESFASHRRRVPTPSPLSRPPSSPKDTTRTQWYSSVSSRRSTGSRSRNYAASLRPTPSPNRQVDHSSWSSYKRDFHTATAMHFSTPKRGSPRAPTLKVSDMDLLVSNMMSMSVSGPSIASVSVGEFGVLA